MYIMDIPVKIKINATIKARICGKIISTIPARIYNSPIIMMPSCF